MTTPGEGIAALARYLKTARLLRLPAAIDDPALFWKDLALVLKRGSGPECEGLLVEATPATLGGLPRLAALARRLGYGRLLLVARAADLDVDGLEALAEFSPLILRDIDRAPAGLLEALHVRGRAWFSHRIAGLDPDPPLEARIRADLQANASGVLLGYPLDAAERQQPFPKVEDLRDSLVESKRRLIREALPVALWGYPICAISYGEPLGLPVLPLPELLDLHDGRGWPPREFWRGFAPHGLVRCACLSRPLCPGLPEAYTAAHPQPASLGVDYLQPPEGGDSAPVIRPTLRCNQNCGFCFVRHDGPDLSLAEAKARLLEIGSNSVTLSGGEPSLWPHLNELIRWAKTQLAADVTLQTNAVRYASPLQAKALIATGLDMAFVSLHSHQAGESDALTGLAGSFEKTLRGIEALSVLPRGVVINHVMNRRNFRHLAEFVRFLDSRFPMRRSPRYKLNLALVGVMGADAQPELRAVVPRVSELAPYLIEAGDYLAKQGIRFEGLETPCGVPRCVVGFDPRFHPAQEPVFSPDFVQGPQCVRCSYSACCYGLRRNYALVYGTDELTPDR